MSTAITNDNLNEAGATMTCSNPDCGCQLTIDAPCPHGSDYRCGCGHPFTIVPAGQASA